MPNEAKTPAQWEKDFIELARGSNVSLRGRAPSKKMSKIPLHIRKLLIARYGRAMALSRVLN